MDTISKKLITLMFLGFAIGFILALFIFPLQVHITAICKVNNEVMLNQYRTIIRDIELRLVGCEDIEIKISKPNLYEILFKKEPEIINTILNVSKEVIGSIPAGSGEATESEQTGVKYTSPKEPLVITPIPTTLEIFDLCSPSEETLESMEWCLNKKPPYDISFEDNENIIKVIIDQDKIKNYDAFSPFTFAYLFVKDVKNIQEPYVVRIVGPNSDHFSIGTISKLSTIMYQQLTEVTISIPLIYDPTLPFPESTGRSELQFYIETEEGHHPIGEIQVYFKS